MSVVCPDCGGDCDSILAAMTERRGQVARERQGRLGRLDEGGVHAAVPGRRLPAIPAPLEGERKIGRRVIRAGDIVRITGHGRGCIKVRTDDGWRFVPGFRVLGFRGDEVHVIGARNAGRGELFRVFSIAQIGRRTQEAPQVATAD